MAAESEVCTLMACLQGREVMQWGEVEPVLWKFRGRREYFVLGRVSGAGGIRDGFKEEGAFRLHVQKARRSLLEARESLSSNPESLEERGV